MVIACGSHALHMHLSLDVFDASKLLHDGCLQLIKLTHLLYDLLLPQSLNYNVRVYIFFAIIISLYDNNKYNYIIYNL